LNDKVREKVREKQDAHAALVDSRTDKGKEANEVRYKNAKRIGKNVAAIAKNSIDNRIYRKLKTKEDETEVFKLARVRERRIRDSVNIRCIKDVNGNIRVDQVEVKE